MGFWGSYLIARVDTALGDHPAVAALGGEIDLALGEPGGWQVVAVHQADPEATEESGSRLLGAGAPVLTAVVADSDFAQVSAATPDGARWEGLVNRETAAGYGFPVDELVPTDDLDGVLAWARAATGREPDPDAVSEALQSQHTFAEEGLQQLAVALGVWP